jgi:integrase
MKTSPLPKTLAYLPNFTARKVQAIPGGLAEDVPDSLAAWATRYLALAVVGVRSVAVTHKIALHLDRFVAFVHKSYGHDRISTCLRRDVLAWQKALVEQGLAPATVNNHLASLSALTTWVAVQEPTVFPVGDPAKGVRELGLPPLEPRALSPAQVRSLKNLCDRLERFHQLKGQR